MTDPPPFVIMKFTIAGIPVRQEDEDNRHGNFLRRLSFEEIKRT